MKQWARIRHSCDASLCLFYRALIHIGGYIAT